ncbi:hypothetical protein MYX76_18260, partial [Desulfobacterota bacterium AH_259_B03_O07]|nr:hypothetical protein [Desulfobacterota bacterium AH_259_B03_O07]
TTVKALVATSTLFVGGTTGSKFIVNGDGNVGIGTKNPSSILHLSGSNARIFLQDANQAADNEKWLWGISGTSFLGQAVNDLESAGTTWINVDRTGTTIDRVYFPNGNLGIGTTSPASLLSVQGNALISGTTTVEGLIATSSAFLAVDSGNVGIGTRAPNTKLYVRDSSNSFLTIDTSGEGTRVAGIYSVRDPNDGASGVGGELLFATKGTGAIAEALRIDINGNLGIGTTTPLSLLNLHQSAIT